MRLQREQLVGFGGVLATVVLGGLAVWQALIPAVMRANDWMRR